MLSDPINLQAKLNAMRFGVDLKQRIECSDEENEQYREMEKQGLSLPSDIFKMEETYDRYYRVYVPSELTETERNEYIQLLKLRELKSIKNCLKFFVILTIISMVIGVIIGIVFSGQLAI